MEFHSSIHSVGPSSLGRLESSFHCDAILGSLTICGSQYLVVVAKSEVVASFPHKMTVEVSSETPTRTSLLDMDLTTALESAQNDSEWTVKPERLILGTKKVSLVPFDLPLDKVHSIVFPEGVASGMPWSPSAPTLFPSDDLVFDATHGVERSRRHQLRPRSASPHVTSEPEFEVVDGSDTGVAGRLSLHIGERASNLVRGIEKMLSSGFYFSYDIDFSRSLQHGVLYRKSTNLSSRPQMLPCWRSIDVGGYLDPMPAHLSNIMQARLREPSYVDSWEEQFLWNHHMVTPFVKAGVDLNWLIPITQGSVSSLTIEHPIHSVEITVICRRSKWRGGTRYNHRGIDDDGNVANFCESETILHVGRMRPESLAPLHRESLQEARELPAGSGWAASVQIRGSVPLYWEQNGMIINPPPIIYKTYRDAPESFKIHHDTLHRNYGDVFYFNLLSVARNQEPRLTKALVEALEIFSTTEQRQFEQARRTATKAPSPGQVSHVNWDFHSQVKSKGFESALEGLFKSDPMQQALYASGAFVERPLWTSGATMQFQSGIIRTNCLDCLDRTNALQMYVAFWWVSAFLAERGLKTICSMPSVRSFELQGSPAMVRRELAEEKVTDDVIFCYFGGQESQCVVTGYQPVNSSRNLFYQEDTAVNNPLRDQLGLLWADHGDKISMAYTGTGSVLSAVIKHGKASFSTNVDHVFRSIGRLYQNTFEDNFRQECLQVMLNWNSSATTSASRRPTRSGPTTTRPPPPSALDQRRKLVVWNGTYNLAGREPEACDLPALRDWLMLDKLQADVYVLCFQELVELTGVRILLSQPDRDREWTIDCAIRDLLGETYIKLRSASLVGLYLSVIVRRSFINDVSNLTCDELKLGFKGQMGNKGAVLVRVTIGRESYVFGNVHLTPGTGRFDERRNQLRAVIRKALGSADPSM